MSHRGNLTERLVVIPALLAEKPHTQRELADQFGVNKKTIRRDIDELSRRHPIRIERTGRDVTYIWSSNHRYSSPVFTPGELSTLLLAEESIAAIGLFAAATPFANYGKPLLDKVRLSLPGSLRATLESLSKVIGSATSPAKDFSSSARIIDQLTQAAVSQHRVRIRYYSLHRHVLTERVVDPYAIYFDPDGATIKFVGHDNFRNRITTFAVDHVRSLRDTGESFRRPNHFELRDFLIQNYFNGFHGEAGTVRLRAHGIAARVFAERRFHPSQKIIETRNLGREGEFTTIEMKVAGGRGLVRFVLSWAPDVEVLLPYSLKKEVEEAHRKALERLSQST
jgi:predicted DNA-binding transcriptional regulator YafY